MKICLRLFVLVSLLASSLYAQTMPVVHQNMQVIQNGDPTRCESSWNSEAEQEDVIRYGADQADNLSGPVIRSCTGCTMTQIGPESRACVCKTCYDYFQ